MGVMAEACTLHHSHSHPADLLLYLMSSPPKHQVFVCPGTGPGPGPVPGPGSYTSLKRNRQLEKTSLQQLSFKGAMQSQYLIWTSYSITASLYYFLIII